MMSHARVSAGVDVLRVVVAGGGTGGHLFPGLAVARELVRRSPNTRVTFVGTARGLETRVVPAEGFELEVIRSTGLKGKPLVERLAGLAVVPLSAIDVLRVLVRRRPSLVVGVGGYSSGPVVMLAALAGIPTLVLEQNAIPGITNRLLANVVRAAAVSYDVTLPYFKGKGFVSGNPVRPEFFARGGTTDAETGSARPGRAARILIFGGSQGAHAINMAMVEAASELAAVPERLSITHQTGERDLVVVRDAYRRVGLEARVEPFLNAMGREMRAADLLVCRAGATTIAELAAVGRAAILVPLPTAADDHQRENAAALARAGAADVIDQDELDGHRLAGRIVDFVRDTQRRVRVAARAHEFARPDAARVIVDRALALLK